jgi:transformer-2 protein
MAEQADEGKAPGTGGAGQEKEPAAGAVQKTHKDVEKLVKPEPKEGKVEVKEKIEIKEVKEKHEIKEGKIEVKEKPEIKEHKNEVKEHKPEFKEHKPEFKEHKPEIKEHKNESKEHKPEIKEHKPEIKETKLEKHEIKEFKVELEKHPKLEVKEFDKVIPDKLPGKESFEGPQGQPGDPSPFAGLSREALEAHATSLEQQAEEIRHFIEQADRPDTGGGALQNEADQ